MKIKISYEYTCEQKDILEFISKIIYQYRIETGVLPDEIEIDTRKLRFNGKPGVKK